MRCTFARSLVLAGYQFSLEKFEANYAEIEPLYRTHYAEMQERLAADGVAIPDYKPRLDQYTSACRAGYLLHYVVRTETGEAVGYSNVYLTSDMHNGELIVREDTIFVRKDHRNGVGRRFVKFILGDLRPRGVRKVNVIALTDLRVANLWRRMGFKEVGVAMTYVFQD